MLEIQNIGRKKHISYVVFDYYFKYSVNGKEYNSYSSIKKDDSTYISHPYSVGDTFNIYYNTEAPEDFRRDIEFASETKLYVIETILFGLVLFGLGKSIIDKKNNKV